MWRGPVAAAVDAFTLTLGATHEPDVTDMTERMEASSSAALLPLLDALLLLIWLVRLVCRLPALNASPSPRRRSTAAVQLTASGVTASLASGRYEAGGSALAVTLHRAAGLQQLGGTLLALPFVEAPAFRVW